ncbi:MAG TPA: aminotransferase class I/II-fold pyridoxal phosphate-dependent enzyme [Dongiaceae bacterium]
MALDRLESLMKFHPFTRLNKLLENVMPGGGNTPFLLSVGEPQFSPPSLVAEKVAEAAGQWGKYPLATGTEAFRQAVRSWADKRYDLPTGLLNADQHILPVAGTREALFHIALSVVPEYDRSQDGERPVVLMPNPFYHVYAGAAAAAGAEPYFVPARADSNFLPVIADIPPAILKRTVLAYLCSPANPQGSIADLDYLTAWLRLARQHDFVLASDECYAEIYLETPPPGALTAARDLGGSLDKLLVFHSLSKRSSGAGLRSGFIAGDTGLIKRQIQLVNYGGVAQPYPILHAATALWQDEDHVIANRQRYQQNFALAQQILGPIFGEIRSAGGFFLWLDVGDGERATVELWRRTAIKVLPGGYMARPDDHGDNPGARYIRVALVYEPTEMEPVLKRMAAVLADLVGKHAIDKI